MTVELSLLEKALATAALDQLPTILGELERLKMVVWQRAMQAEPKEASATLEGQCLLTIPQAAARLNIPESRAYELARRHGGLPVIKIGKYLRVDPSVLQKWLREQDKTVDKNISATYSHPHDRVRAQRNSNASRLNAGGTGRTARRPLELHRAAGTRGDRDSRVPGAPSPTATGSE